MELINQLYNAFNENKAKTVMGSILDELIKYSIVHFSYEEKYFSRFPNGEFKEHIKQHEAFKEKVLEFKQKFERGNPITFRVMTFLRDWLTDHIQITDMQYVEKIKNL